MLGGIWESGYVACGDATACSRSHPAQSWCERDRARAAVCALHGDEGEGKRQKNILILSFSPLATHGAHWRSKFVFADPWLTCEHSCTSLCQGNPQPSSRVRRRMQPHGAAHAASHSADRICHLSFDPCVFQFRVTDVIVSFPGAGCSTSLLHHQQRRDWVAALFTSSPEKVTGSGNVIFFCEPRHYGRADGICRRCCLAFKPMVETTF